MRRSWPVRLIVLVLVITADADTKRRRRRKKALPPVSQGDGAVDGLLTKLLTSQEGTLAPDVVAFEMGTDDLWQRPPKLLRLASAAFHSGRIARAHRCAFAAYMHAVTRGDTRGFTPPRVRAKYELTPEELERASQLHMGCARLLARQHEKTEGHTPSPAAIETAVNSELGLNTDPDKCAASDRRNGPGRSGKLGAVLIDPATAAFRAN